MTTTTTEPVADVTPPPAGDYGDAESLVKKYAFGSLAVGLVPLPLIDLAALTALQLMMLSRLSRKFDVNFSEQRARSFIWSLAGAGGATGLRAGIMLMVRSIPGPHRLAMVATTALTGSASTYAIGKVFIQHFESGGTFLTFDPEKVRAHYAEQFQQGLALAKSFAGQRP
jgi:uncharacterized protein (DUF697 family)